MSRTTLLVTWTTIMIASPAPALRSAPQTDNECFEPQSLHPVDLRAELMRIATNLKDERVDDPDPLDGMYERARDSELVWDAGLSGNRAYVAPLIGIAEAAIGRRHEDLSYVALRSLMRLGEPDEFFEALVERYPSNPGLALHAMRALAEARPNPARVARFTEIARHADSLDTTREKNAFSGVATHAARGWIAFVRNRELELDERVDELAYFSGGIESVFGCGPRLRSPGSWMEEELHRLSLEQPSEVAKAFAQARFLRFRNNTSTIPQVSGDEHAKLIREIASRCLGEECHALWRLLEPADERIPPEETPEDR